MSTSERLFLEESCSTLQQLLLRSLVEEQGSDVTEQDFQDFEVGYSVSSVESTIKVKVIYPFLLESLKHGSQDLLERVWEGFPLRLQVIESSSQLQVSIDSAALANDAATGRLCAQRLATTRTWLLIGPLLSRLRWLRDAMGAASGAAAKASPGNASAAAAAALGQPPPPLELQLRRLETCWIVPKQDRVLVILSVHLEDEGDVALARAFCQEFAETNRKGTEFSLPCTFHEPKDIPTDVRGKALPFPPNVGFLTLTLSDQHVQGASEERLIALARPVMTFRNFFNFHLKNTKSYLHSRLRKRLDGWQQQLNRARRRRAQEKRRLISGKEFVPPTRAGASA